MLRKDIFYFFLITDIKYSVDISYNWTVLSATTFVCMCVLFYLRLLKDIGTSSSQTNI